MNEKLIVVIVVFGAVVGVEVLASVLGWRKRPGAAKPLLGLAIVQVALPASLLILGIMFPPSPSPDALNFGIFHGILLIFVPWIEFLLWAIGLITATVIFVTLFRQPKQKKETQQNT